MRGRGRGRKLVRPALALLVGLLAATGAQAQVLSILSRDALAADPGLAGAQAQVQAAEQRVVQAQAGFGPTVGITATSNDSRYNEAPAYDLRRFNSQQTVLQVTQPLLRNALLPALEAAQAQLEQARAALVQARGDATLKLVEASFEVLKARDAVALAGAQKVAAQEQLQSARRKFTIGTATVVDVREAEAKIDTVAALVIAAQGEFELRQDVLTELVGRPTPELLDRGLNGETMPPLKAAEVLGWIADAQLHSPQLVQAQKALLAAQAELRKAWQGHAPTADLVYSHTRSSDSGTVTSVFPRRGNISQLGVNVSIPLFASGGTQARVKEVSALRDKADSDVEVARRTVQLGVRQNFTATLSAISLARGLLTATRSLEIAMLANRRAYEVGMKVNAEVLEAQSKVFESRRDLSRARYDAWLSFLRLKSFAGQLFDSDVQGLDAVLVLEPSTGLRGISAAREAGS